MELSCLLTKMNVNIHFSCTARGGAGWTLDTRIYLAELEVTVCIKSSAG